MISPRNGYFKVKTVARRVGISSSYLSELLKGTRGRRSFARWGPLIARELDMTTEELRLRIAAGDFRQDRRMRQ